MVWKKGGDYLWGLSIKVIDHLLNAFPIDITFVDGDNKVRFFNRISKRVFALAKRIIGKEVSNCHPKKDLTSTMKYSKILNPKRGISRNSGSILGGN
jgi:DUF438 domain-containing protein